jgi:acyl dehydratase
MTPFIVPGLEALPGLVGKELGISPWMEVTAERIAAFADATDDHQWIHLDAARAAKESPYGGVVAHGFLTLSLIPALRAATLTIEGVRMAINYGTNRVRFPAPLRAGRRIRGEFRLVSCDPIEGGVQAVIQATVVEENATKPCCVAELVTRLYSSPGPGA